MVYTERESDEARDAFEPVERAATNILDAVRDGLDWDSERQRWNYRLAGRDLRNRIIEHRGYPFDQSWCGRCLIAARLGMDLEEMYPDIVMLADDRQTSTMALEKKLDSLLAAINSPTRRPTMFAKLLSIAFSRARLTAPRPVWSGDYVDSDSANPFGFQ